MTDQDLFHLSTDGVSLVLDARGSGLPTVVYWGAALGELDLADCTALSEITTPAVPSSAADHSIRVAILPEHAADYPGRPGLSGHRMGAQWSASFTLTGVSQPHERSLVIDAVDKDAELALAIELELAASGLLRVRQRVRNEGQQPYIVDGLNVTLPVPPQTAELLDFTGRHCRERSPQRHPFVTGAWVREGRCGRTGLDATIGLCAGTPGFGFRHGEVWALHVGWSGNHVTYAERLPTGPAVLGAGELLLAGEVVLGAGEEYVSPWVFAAYSDQGLDGISAAFHRWFRSRPHHPVATRPRPVVLNTWEAVYFDHDLGRLRKLADVAARIGVERFVLDDGWFRHRRDDTAGLGDWYVDEGVWPEGLHPLIDHVRSLGMEFGLWVEPEMINPDSDLYRAHPDWVLAPEGRLPAPWRSQHVLDLAHPDAYAYILERLDALLTEYPIGYLKWDHNRNPVDATHAGRPGVHAQTQALYRMLDELRARHPGVEIESCASGGGRVDLGILERTDRVWTSDCNDALERQAIQRWTGLLVPPELLGTHVGPTHSHTTGRTHDLSFRALTALFGHAGIEWDVTSATPEEQAELAGWIAFYKQVRGLLHGGDVVRVDHADPAAWVHGVVASDRSEALFCYVQMATSVAAVPAPVKLPGLDPDRRYRVTPVQPVGAPQIPLQRVRPPWYTPEGVTLSGRVLAQAGVHVPVLAPEQALLLRVTPAEA